MEKRKNERKKPKVKTKSDAMCIRIDLNLVEFVKSKENVSQYINELIKEDKEKQQEQAKE